MASRKFKLSVCGIAIAAMAVVGYFSPFEEDETYLLEASLSGILQKVVDAGKPEAPSLSIENVVPEKISNPYRNSANYKYQATVFIKNDGRKFRNYEASLSADNSRVEFVLQNSPEGFSLGRDESYIVKDYEVLFDGNYNAGTVTLEIEGHDSYELEFFETPSKLESIRVENVKAGGEISIGFTPSNLFLSTDDYELFVADSLPLRGKTLNYRELLLQGKIYDYHVLRADEELIKDGEWKKTDSVDLEGNPFEFEDTLFVHVRAINPDTGYYGFSDILVLGPQEDLTRAEFSEFLVKEAGIELFSEGSLFFDDVRPEDRFAPYVQTLFNLGLLDYDDKLFLPNEKITRGEALIAVMDYFDVDLAVKPGKSRFDDIASSNFIYHYTQALFDGGNAGAFGNYFNHDFPASKNYLTHLIHAYK